MSLKHSGRVQDYIKTFSGLMLEIKDMSEEDRLYHFLKGLQPWAQSELRRQNVQHLAAAIAAADKLLDYRATTSKSQEAGDGQPERNSKKKTKSKAKTSEKQGEFKAKKSEVPKERNVKCFVCGGNHYAKECPLKHQTVNAAEKTVQPSVGVLQVLSTVVAEATDCQEQDPTGLSFVSAGINGHTVMALVDSGATHNFMKDSVAKRLDLKLEESPNAVKAVNSKVAKVIGKAKDVSMRLGDWTGVINFTVVQLDDFDVVLGQDFLRTTKATPVTCVDSMVVFSGNDPIVVPMVRKHLEPAPLSTLSISGADKLGTKQTIGQRCQGETSAQTSDDSGLKKEVEQRLAMVESIVKVANLSTASRLAAMENAMGTMVTSVTKIMDSCLANRTTMLTDLEELGAVEVATDTVDLDDDVQVADSRDKKVLDALSDLEQQLDRDDPEITRLWAEGDGHIGTNLPLLMYLSKTQVGPAPDSSRNGVGNGIDSSSRLEMFGGSGIDGHLPSTLH